MMNSMKYTKEDQEAALDLIRDLEIPFVRLEDCIEIEQVFIRRELLSDFAKLMEMNERLESS